MPMLSGNLNKGKGQSRLQLKRRWDRNKYGYLFLVPWILGFFIFNIYPLFYSFILSFTNFDMFQTRDYVGFENYINLFKNDIRFTTALTVTFKYVFIGVPLQLLFALLLALVLNKGVAGLKYFRAAYYLPALMGGSVAIAILWRQVFGIEGIFNQFLGILGVSGQIIKTSWVTNPFYSLYTLILLRVWQFGSPMIIFLAGLKQIPRELYESASIDGASSFKQLLRITLPLLTPIILFNVIMQIISAFQAFTPAFVVGGAAGGVMNSLLFYTLYLYIMAFSYFKMGIASAMAWILMIIIGVFTIIIFRSSTRWVFYNE